MPTRSLVATGMRMEFPVSVPLPRTARLDVTAVTVPPDEPPGEKRTSYAFPVRPKAVERVVSLAAKSGILVTPSRIAPLREALQRWLHRAVQPIRAWDHVAYPSIGGDEASDACVGLVHDGHAPQRAGVKARLICFGVFARGRCKRSFCRDGLDSSIDAVIALDAIEVPLNHLHDGIAMFAIQRMQPIDSNVDEIAVHRGMTAAE